MPGHYKSRVVDQAKNRILKGTVIISKALPDKESMEPIGSGILLYLSGEFFLVTAGHILNHESWANLLIHTAPLFAPSQLVYLQGELISSFIKSDDNRDCDFAILRFYPKMHKHLTSFNPYLEHSILMNHKVIEDDNYLLTGYPWRHIERKGKSFIVEPFTFLTSGVGIKRYERHKFDKDLFALVKYQRRLQRFGDGKIIQARNPQGISGSGLYFIPQFNEAQLVNPEIYLVGIMIENHQDKGFMLAFKIDIIIEIIRNNFQLNNLILPYTKSVGHIGKIYQGDFWERVEAEEIARGIVPKKEEGINRILKEPAPHILIK